MSLDELRGSGAAIVLKGNAMDLPMIDNSVDLVVTSPPYWSQRSYQDAGEHYDGQIGDEPTFDEYLDHMLACTSDWARCLKPSGSIWVNLGDKYTGAGGYSPNAPANVARRAAGSTFGNMHATRRPGPAGMPSKSLIGLPWRYAIRCVDELGLSLRAEVIWAKDNGMPEAVTDRVRRSHEQWFHFTKQPRYFAAIDHLRKVGAGTHTQGPNARRNPDRTDGGRFEFVDNPLGALPGSVWNVATQPLRVPDHVAHSMCCKGIPKKGCADGIGHFAAFPMEFPRRIIQAWSPAAVCIDCGEGRRLVQGFGEVCACVAYTDHPATGAARRDDGKETGLPQRSLAQHAAGDRVSGWREYHVDQWTPAATRPAIVVDPFGGTGTTALVARSLGRVGFSVDMSTDYNRIAEWRTTDPAQLASALEVPRPPVQLEGQQDLFDVFTELGA